MASHDNTALTYLCGRFASLAKEYGDIRDCVTMLWPHSSTL
jgi:hypothetical protein